MHDGLKIEINHPVIRGNNIGAPAIYEITIIIFIMNIMPTIVAQIAQ